MAGTTITLTGGDTTGTLGLQVGSAVSGANVPAGTYITSITDPTHVVVSQAPGAVAGGYNFSLGTLVRSASINSTTVPTATVGTNTITLAGADTTSSLGLQVGEEVFGTGIPAGTYVTAITGTNSFTVSQNTTVALSGVYNFSASGMLDLNGQTAVAGNVVINGVGSTIPAATPAGVLAVGSSGALWNSSPNAASLAGTLTLASTSSVGGNGDLTLNTIYAASGANLTKQGTDTLTLAGNNATTFLGTITVSLGTLKLGGTGALGDTAGGTTSITTVSSGAVLDLNGQTTSENITINSTVGYGGTGTITGVGTVSSLGALINTSASTATVNGNITLGATVSIGSNYINALSGVTPGGDITYAGVFSGAQAITKVGSNTLTITANQGTANLSSVTVNDGSVVVSGAGTLGNGAFVVNAGTASGLNLGNSMLFDYTGIVASINRNNVHSVTLSGGAFTMKGSTSVAENESFGGGALNINNAFNLVTLLNNGANVQLSGTGTVARGTGGTGLVRGLNLGTTVGATTTNVITAAATATGQGGANGAATRAILPWLIVDTSATGSGISFAVSDTTANIGLRPLNTSTEMVTTFTANDNILLNSATPLSAGAATTNYATTLLNSLTFSTAANPTLTINAGQNVTLDSGGILTTVSSTIGGASVATSGFLNAANGATGREMIITTAGSGTTLTINSAVGGAVAPSTAGLTKSGEGTLLLNAAQNNYTGATPPQSGHVEAGPGDEHQQRPLLQVHDRPGGQRHGLHLECRCARRERGGDAGPRWQFADRRQLLQHRHPARHGRYCDQ